MLIAVLCPRVAWCQTKEPLAMHGQIFKQPKIHAVFVQLTVI